jgi:hypothetical protein
MINSGFQQNEGYSFFIKREKDSKIHLIREEVEVAI